MKNVFFFFVIALFFFGCAVEPATTEVSQTLYYGGDIITMRGDQPDYAEALVSSGDTIQFVGTLQEAKKLFSSAKSVNLKGKTLLPGFIDGHAHFAGFPGQSIGAQILPPPDAGANSIDNLLQIL